MNQYFKDSQILSVGRVVNGKLYTVHQKIIDNRADLLWFWMEHYSSLDDEAFKLACNVPKLEDIKVVEAGNSAFSWVEEES